MSASKHWQRSYDESDLDNVMQHAAADDWSDLLHYLEERAVSETRLSRTQAAELAADIEVLKNDNHPFTSDSSDTWKALTGDYSLSPLSGVNGADSSSHDGNVPASSRVLDLLHRLESREYREMAQRVERFGDRGWKND